MDDLDVVKAIRPDLADVLDEMAYKPQVISERRSVAQWPELGDQMIGQYVRQDGNVQTMWATYANGSVLVRQWKLY